MRYALILMLLAGCAAEQINELQNQLREARDECARTDKARMVVLQELCDLHNDMNSKVHKATEAIDRLGANIRGSIVMARRNARLILEGKTDDSAGKG